MSKLADRIRGIVGPSTMTQGPHSVAQGFSPASAAGAPIVDNIAEVLGGAWRDEGGRGCFVVDRRWAPSARHGRERVGALGERLHEAADEATLFSGGAVARPPFMFFDLETTGLSGGAGTLAFLVGCAWFESDGGFATRQFLLTRHADERMLLEAVAAELARAGALVSFNGKSFDAPLLEGRYLFHRLAWRGRELPHVDVLHPARRFWKPGRVGPGWRRDDGAVEPAALLAWGGSRIASGFGPVRNHDGGCSLQALERQIVGSRRVGDVPGFEIPGRYFQFVRSRDARPLEAVLEHNRLDLLTLAALTSRLLHLTRGGPDAVADPREALALGHVYMRGGLDDRARTSYRRAIDCCRSPRSAYDPIRIDALRGLALACRRARQHAEAASCWRALLEIRGCPAPIAREAAEALAVHHEHRLKDLEAAREFAGTALEGDVSVRHAEAMRWRLLRIERKLAGGTGHAGAEIASLLD